ncbi:MAG: hypothetical protein KVP17_000616 [Porospora cf. gigantea B]|uniref:uncharacterized protein n=1 Tax=Porospora cf. gigantea B TaxID=2853592 RepID=UPI003571A041|nr:MAG: hypothetical protein KVP17_000616 [Porospora cf. gigantea B]
MHRESPLSLAFSLVLWSVTEADVHMRRAVENLGKAVPAVFHSWQGIKNVLAESSHVFVILQPKDHMRAVLEALRVPQPPHIFSAHGVSVTRQMMTPVVGAWRRGTRSLNSRSVWSFAEPFRYETSVTKMRHLMADIGPVRGGSIVYTHPTEDVETMTRHAIAMVRRMLGDLRGGQSWKTTSGVGGVLCLITNQAEVTVNIESGPQSLLHATFLGREGKAVLSNTGEGLLEVQRQMGGTFENPSLHESTGRPWSLKGWQEHCADPANADPNTPEAALIDISIAEAFIVGNGVPLALVVHSE